MLNDLIFPKKRDVLYEAAISATKSISKLIKLTGEGKCTFEVDKNSFHKIFSNDPKSPTIYFLSDTEYIIYYPPYSSRYSNTFTKEIKNIEVLKGVLFDENSGKKIFKGDKVKILPSDEYTPYTEDQEAYIRVCIGDSRNLIDRICG